MTGLYNKYTVTNNQTGREMTGVFILKPDTDLAARAALLSYAAHVAYENPLLAADLRAWVKALAGEAEGEPSPRLVTLRARIEAQNAAGVIDEAVISRERFEQRLEALKAQLAELGITFRYSIEETEEPR